MSKKLLLIFMLVLAKWIACISQPYFPAKGKLFNDTIVSRIDIIIDPDSLNDMYANIYNEHLYYAEFMFTQNGTTDTLVNIGFGLRGNTSLGAAKKSFKISFNSFNGGGKYEGVEKINLNGEHNDPSVVRSKLYWDAAAAAHVVGARAAHCQLYINGVYYGLYINVEHMDEEWLQKRYGNDFGNYFKCLWPADLAYLGSNANAYKLMSGNRRVYDLQTNKWRDDYTDFRNFITALHAAPSPGYQAVLEKQFNVNAFLRTYAMDVLAANWDNYAGNMNNYYLYHNPQTDKFDYVPYDVDNTFGIDWFGINWAQRDIYNWNTPGRPLVEKLFAYQDYRDRFSYFMNKNLQSFFNGTNLISHTDSIKNLIAPYIINDTYYTLDYGFDYSDFLNSYTQGLGMHIPIGLLPYIQQRHATATSQLSLNNVPPIFSETRCLPLFPHHGDTLFIKSWVEDEAVLGNVYLHYKVGSSGVEDSVLMYDNGGWHDDVAGDGIYVASTNPAAIGDTIFYFLSANDAIGSYGREPRSGFCNVDVKDVPKLVFNEWLAGNTTSVMDNAGEHEDFVEIYNTDSLTSIMRYVFISDDISKPGKWHMYDTTLAANAILLLWADNDTEQGWNHMDFKLNNAGEQLIMTEYTGYSYRYIDTLSFGAMTDNISLGCYPDGVKPYTVQQSVTAGVSNLFSAQPTVSNTTDIMVVPNPVVNVIQIKCSDCDGANAMVFAANGLLIYSVKEVHNGTTIDMQLLPAGMYVVVVNHNETQAVWRLIK